MNARSKIIFATVAAAVLFLVVGTTTTSWSSYLRQGVQVDPDKNCRAVYQKDPTKATCLATNDDKGQPCQYCDIGDKNFICADKHEAFWAKLFGGTCEKREEVEEASLFQAVVVE